MAKIDLKDAYFMVPIHREDRGFLKFKFKNRCFRFNCLPFGLAGMRSLGLYQSPKACGSSAKTAGGKTDSLYRRHTDYSGIARKTEEPYHGSDLSLGEPGIHYWLQECVLEPTQLIDFLGFTVDSNSQEIRLPADKIKKIRAEARNLDLRFRRYLPEFQASSLSKQSRQDKPRTEFFFPAFQGTERLCPVHTLKVYEEGTKELRLREAQSKLLLGVIKPHNPVAPSTVARWLRTVLDRAGIDLSLIHI